MPRLRLAAAAGDPVFESAIRREFGVIMHLHREWIISGRWVVNAPPQHGALLESSLMVCMRIEKHQYHHNLGDLNHTELYHSIGRRKQEEFEIIRPQYPH